MTIHREGFKSIALTTIIFIILNMVMRWFFAASLPWLCILFFLLTLGFLIFVISFFRIPNRTLTIADGKIISPADGKVVVIEETVDEEYFKGKRLQISVFMSPLNVHVNRNPMDGEVVYNKYHKGKYLVAWDPKSSTDNERHSVVLKNGNVEVLVKQIAGAVARRIVNYLEVGNKVKQTDEYGFIKFGSRVDLLLPIGTQVNVQLNEVVKGGVTVLATL
jgi:phosphatidylserine decarboxylase